MAGTTVEDPGAVNLCFRDALAAAGLVVPFEQVNAVMGLAKPLAIRKIIERSRDGEIPGDRIDEIHRDFLGRMIRYYREDASVREVPGIGRLFERLKAQGVKIALDTGFSREIARVVLDRLRWTAVDASVASDEVPRGRPFPDMIQALMKRLQVEDVEQVAKVGDAPADLEEGRNAGCGWVIGVTWGTHSRDQLAALPHTHLVDSIDALDAVLMPASGVSGTPDAGDRSAGPSRPAG